MHRQKLYVRTAAVRLENSPAAACRLPLLDAGGNMGFVSLYAFAMGANVVYVEPQIDLVEAMQASVALNCAGERITVLHGALMPDKQPEHVRLNLSVPGFRSCQGSWGTGSRQSGAGPLGAPIVSVDELVSAHRHWDLVKIDIDSIDAQLVERFLQHIRSGYLTVTSFIVEWNGGKARGDLLHALQQELGYDVYR